MNESYETQNFSQETLKHNARHFYIKYKEKFTSQAQPKEEIQIKLFREHKFCFLLHYPQKWICVWLRKYAFSIEKEKKEVKS